MHEVNGDRPRLESTRKMWSVPVNLPHEQYLALGGRGWHPADAYRELFKNDLESELVDQIRDVTNGNNVLAVQNFLRLKQSSVAACRGGARGGRKKSTI